MGAHYSADSIEIPWMLGILDGISVVVYIDVYMYRVYSFSPMETLEYYLADRRKWKKIHTSPLMCLITHTLTDATKCITCLFYCGPVAVHRG